MTDLHNLNELKQACADAIKTAQKDDHHAQWGQRLRDFLVYVRDADREKRVSEEFQRRIWEENPVSAVGMGTIPLEAAIKDPDFREWIAEQSQRSLPEAEESKRVALDELFVEIQGKIEKYTKRRPRLKIYRVLAGFFPADFTTISHVNKLRRLQMAMLGHRKGQGPTCHSNVLSRLSEALGPPDDDLDSIADRMRLPWLLFKYYVAPSEGEKTESTKGIPGDESLVPLPAARKRRGLTGSGAGLQAVLNILEFCREGASREDLKSHIRTINPALKDSSIGLRINVLIGEFNCLRANGDQYILTDRGHALLESGDPAELMDWLITRILGVDHVFVILRDEASCPMQDMMSKLKRVNPGWTSDWAPKDMVNTLRAYRMLTVDDKGVLSLTDDGKEWANRINWKPESLVKEDEPATAGSAEPESPKDDPLAVRG